MGKLQFNSHTAFGWAQLNISTSRQEESLLIQDTKGTLMQKTR